MIPNVGECRVSATVLLLEAHVTNLNETLDLATDATSPGTVVERRETVLLEVILDFAREASTVGGLDWSCR